MTYARALMCGIDFLLFRCVYTIFEVILRIDGMTSRKSMLANGFDEARFESPALDEIPAFLFCVEIEKFHSGK